MKKGFPATNILLLILLAIIWGSSYILMKKGLVSFSALQVSMLRIVFASVALLPFLPAALKNINKRDTLFALVVALLGSGLPSYLYPLAITNIDSGLAGIVNSLTPVFTLFFGWLFFNSIVGFNKVLGLAIAMAGAGFLVLYNNTDYPSFNLNWYALAAVLATVCYGLSSNFLKSKLNHVNALQLTSLTFILISPAALIILLSTNFIEIVKTEPSAMFSVFYIFILGSIGTGFALVLFNYLIKRTDAMYATSVTFLIPIVAIFWGLLDNEKIGIYHLLGLICILAGVYIMNNNNNFKISRKNN